MLRSGLSISTMWPLSDIPNNGASRTDNRFPEEDLRVSLQFCCNWPISGMVLKIMLWWSIHVWTK